MEVEKIKAFFSEVVADKKKLMLIVFFRYLLVQATMYIENM